MAEQIIVTDESCPECGELLELSTTADQTRAGRCGCAQPCDCYIPEHDWWACDGDKVLCSGCGWESYIDISDGDAYVVMP
jgi:hypothetical protein